MQYPCSLRSCYAVDPILLPGGRTPVDTHRLMARESSAESFGANSWVQSFQRTLFSDFIVQRNRIFLR